MIPGIVAGASESSAPGPTPQPWTPADIITELWLDAADVATITQQVLGFVSQWNDKSGNARHFTQPSGPDRPSYVSGELNGLNVLRFVSNDRLVRSSGLTGLTQNVPGATFVCLRRWPVAPTAVQILYGASIASSPNARANLEGGRTSGRSGFGGRRLDADGFQNITASAAMSTNWEIQIATIDYANSDAELYMDGVLAASTTSFQTDGNTSDTASQSITIGCATNQSSGFFAGEIAELLVTNSAAPIAVRQQIEGYLAWKWGLQSNLPLGHPYKDSPP